MRPTTVNCTEYPLSFKIWTARCVVGMFLFSSILPAYTESFGLVYAEAMSQGLPVIYSKGQGFDSQFDEGYIGYSVDARSPEDVADAIIRILDGYAEISGRCAEASKKFMWNKIARVYDSTYQCLKKVV